MPNTKDIIAAVRNKEWTVANDHTRSIIQQKMHERLAQEKIAVGKSLTEALGWSGSTPADQGRMAAADDDYAARVKVGDKIRTIRGGQIPGLVTKVENGRVYFDVENPGGWSKTKTMYTTVDNVIKEDAEYPTNWDKGFSHPYRIGGGGSERPFLKNGKWYLYVWNSKTGKHEYYDYSADVYLPDTAGILGESTLSLAEIQRVYDETGGDISETELLCNVRRLTVNDKGQVIAAVNEGVGNWSLRKTKQQEIDGEEDARGEKLTWYDVLRDGKKVGDLKDGLWGNLTGSIAGKNVTLTNYSSGDGDPHAKLHKFIKSNTGQQFLTSVGLNEGFEETHGHKLCPKCQHPAHKHYYFGCDEGGCQCPYTERDFEKRLKEETEDEFDARRWGDKCGKCGKKFMPYDGQRGLVCRTCSQLKESSMTSPSVRKLNESSDHDALFASDLGWKPGEWPKVLKFDGNEYNRTGEVSRDREGDIQYVVYAFSDFYNKSKAGQKAKVHVYND